MRHRKRKKIEKERRRLVDKYNESRGRLGKDHVFTRHHKEMLDKFDKETR